MQQRLLQGLYEQVPQPVLILGDFNAYYKIWECTSTYPRGRILENFAEVNELEILNSGAPTRLEYNTETCIDLTIATPTLRPLLQWTVTTTPRDSDHIPIVLNILNERQRGGQTTRRYMKKADRVKYRESEAWKPLDMDMSSMSNEEILLDLCARIDRAAEE